MIKAYNFQSALIISSLQLLNNCLLNTLFPSRCVSHTRHLPQKRDKLKPARYGGVDASIGRTTKNILLYIEKKRAKVVINSGELQKK